MPSTADVEALRRVLNAISARAKADLARIWAGLDTADVRAVRKALEVAWPELLATYGDLTATVAADVFEVWADELGLRPKVELVRPVDPERANARMRWAIGQPQALGSLTVILDELVKQPGRRTIQRSAEASGGAWARVPTGADTCSFCRMLASRGAVYSSKESALRVGGRGAPGTPSVPGMGGRGRRAGGIRLRGSQQYGAKFHGDCDCTTVLVRGPEDYPKGYDPDALYEQYDAARSAADSGNPKAILSAMREQDGTH